MKQFLVLPILVFLISSPLLSQEEENILSKANAAEAEKKMLAGNYEEAVDDYLSLYAEQPEVGKHAYNIAVCYLNMDENKTKAIPYLEKLVHNEKHDPNTEYLLAVAYHLANRFDEAISMFGKFKLNGKGNAENLKSVDQQIQYCLNAKELMKFPSNVSFENLGKQINSEYNEQYAFVPIDESFIMFNTTRPEKNALKEENGEYKNSIYLSQVLNGNYQKALLLGEPLCKGNSGNELIGMNADGSILLIGMSNGGSKQVYVSNKGENGNYSKPVLLDKTINYPGSEVIAASISSEGDVIYFASNRTGGFGGTDIFMSTKMPNGKWGQPINLGPGINTSQNEDFPNVSPDGKTLYFSSTGHTSMGGYDIFKANFNAETGKWENAKNIGFPINTTGNDMNFRITSNTRYGYISCARRDGLGGLDNYRIVFNDIEPELSVVKGTIVSEDNKQINYPDILMTVTNEKTKEIIGTYLPNPNTGNYVIILPPGNYLLEVELFNFKLLKKKLEIKDKVSYQSEIELDLKLEIAK